MAFDIINGIRSDPCNGMCFGNCVGLTVDRRRKIPSLGRTVIVDRASFDDGPNMIAICKGVFKTTQHDDARSRSENRPLRAVIECMTRAVGRQDFVYTALTPKPEVSRE